MGQLLWLILGLGINAHYMQSSATIASGLVPRENTTPTSEGIQDLSSIALQTPSAAVTNGNTLNTNSTQFIQNNCAIYDNLTSPGRHLIQVDKVLQQKYWLVSCKAGVPGAQAEQVKNLVTQIRLNLQLVIREAQKGMASEFGFEAFFKSNDNVLQVLKIFNMVLNAHQIKAPEAYGRSHWLMPKKGPPIIGCALSIDDEFTGQAYWECKHPLQYAFHPLYSAWIYLCPLFWDIPKATSKGNCPQFYENGTVGPDEMALHNNQEAVLVHELVHMYLSPPPANPPPTPHRQP